MTLTNHHFYTMSLDIRKFFSSALAYFPHSQNDGASVGCAFADPVSNDSRVELKKMKAKEMVMTEAELLEPGKGSC